MSESTLNMELLNQPLTDTSGFEYQHEPVPMSADTGGGGTNWLGLATTALGALGGGGAEPTAAPAQTSSGQLLSGSNTGIGAIDTGDKDFSYNAGFGANAGKTITDFTSNVLNADPWTLGAYAVVALGFVIVLRK